MTPPKTRSSEKFLRKTQEKKKILRNPVRNAFLGPKNKFLKRGITNLGVRNGAAGFNVCCIGALFVHRSFSVASFITAVSCGVAATYLNLSIKHVFGAMPSLTTFAFNAVIITCTLFAFDSPGALPQLPNTV